MVESVMTIYAGLSRITIQKEVCIYCARTVNISPSLERQQHRSWSTPGGRENCILIVRVYRRLLKRRPDAISLMLFVQSTTRRTHSIA